MKLLSRLVPLVSQLFPKLSSRILASSGYTLDIERFGGLSGFTVWTRATALRQDRAWQPIVAAAKDGRLREDVAVLHEAITSLGTPPEALVEVGCGGGYISEILRSWLPQLEYHGVDLSTAMIEIASDHYPERSFAVGSAYELPLADRGYSVVIDGVALIHMPDWKRALAEYARVASGHVILHGLTLTESAPTTVFAKYAYGQPSMELVFNREELASACDALGLNLTGIHGGLDYNLKPYIGIQSISETWVLSVPSS